MGTAATLGTIETQVPARMDRLPWSRFHWRVLVGLGTVWILDGLEVTMVGAVAARLTEDGSGITLTAGDIGIAAACYIAGACLGALFFGQLTDRFGRKKLFILTLAVYVGATVATAFAFSPWYFFLARFVTGAGIGGEYAAINSAIDELVPARVRGRVDLVINGTYWAGAAGGSALAILFLNTSLFPIDLGWRFAFGMGAVLGFLILIVRRNVPESPRWLFIHGREEEAERIVGGIEEQVHQETGQELEAPEESITVRQRTTIPFRTIARTAFKVYPKRSVLGVSLFVGQAFIYNGITFSLGTLFATYYGVSAGFVPVFLILYAVGNFLGPVTLGRLFDTVGRKPMISACYLGSALMTIPLAWVFVTGAGGEWLLLCFIMATFFLASAGASAAYLTVSEIFPMETRALAIAFFYAIGTGLGGIVGPLLFGRMIESGDRNLVAVSFGIGAVVMAVGGIVEILFGVRAEQQSLEDLAKPLTAQEAEQETPAATGAVATGAAAAARPRDADQVPRTEHSRVQEEATEADQIADLAHAEDERAAAEQARAEASAHADNDALLRAEQHEQRARAHEQRIRDRAERRREQERTGSRRWRPGPGRGISRVWGLGADPAAVWAEGRALDREIEAIARTVAERGPTGRNELGRLVGARYWGPGRFSAALRVAVAEGRIVRLPRRTYGPGE